MEKPTFVWPPPEEDLEDWQVVPLFTPSAAEPLPEPVLVPEVQEPATVAVAAVSEPVMSSAVATTAPLVMAAGSARARIQLPERLLAIEKIETTEAIETIEMRETIETTERPAVDEIETVSLTRPIVSAAPIASEAIDAVEALKPIEPIEAVGPLEAIESIAVTEATEATKPMEPAETMETMQAIDMLAIASPSPSPSIALATPRTRPSGATGTRIVAAAALVCAVGGSAYIATRSFMPRPAATAPATARAGTVTGTGTGTAAAEPTTSVSAATPAPGALGSEARRTTTSASATTDVDATPERVNEPATEIAASANIPPVPGETSLEVRSLPAGAKVIFGGRERGVTPLVITGLVPGRHDVMVEGPFPRVFRRVDVTEGERALLIVGGPTDAATRGAHAAGTQATPAAPATPANVSPSGAADASAATGGGARPSTPRNAPAAPAAPVTPSASATSSVVSSASGASASGATPSTAAPIAPSTMGRLVVQSPLALDVIANGRRIGNSGDGSLPLAPGSHELELINDSVDYREVTTVHVSAGQRLVLPVEIPQSTLTVEASPGTRIWVDGRDIGEVSHAQLALPIGPHEVRFRHPDFGERRITALVKIGLAARAAVDFKSTQP